MFVVIVHLCQMLKMSLPLMKCYVYVELFNVGMLVGMRTSDMYRVCIWQTRVNSTLLTFNKRLYKEEEKKYRKIPAIISEQ